MLGAKERALAIWLSTPEVSLIAIMGLGGPRVLFKVFFFAASDKIELSVKVLCRPKEEVSRSPCSVLATFQSWCKVPKAFRQLLRCDEDASLLAWFACAEVKFNE